MDNKHIGSDFTDFLKQEGIFEETRDIAVKRVLVYQLQEEMRAQKITKTRLAELMRTSRAVVNRLLNPDNTSLTLTTLQAAAAALGKRLSIQVV